MPGFAKRKTPHPEPFPYDKKRLCSGHYTDAYFLNAVQILDRLVADSYHFDGEYPVLSSRKDLASSVSVGSIAAEIASTISAGVAYKVSSWMASVTSVGLSSSWRTVAASLYLSNLAVDAEVPCIAMSLAIREPRACITFRW